MSSAILQRRAAAFLKQPVPVQLDYVPGSIAENFISEVAETGTLSLDDNTSELFLVCIYETQNGYDDKTGAAREYLKESADLIMDIYKSLVCSAANRRPN